VGIGVPIPILNEGLAKKTSVVDEDILVNVLDYGVPRRERPSLRKVSYKELKSGLVTIGGKEVKVSPLSSLYGAKKIAETLKKWIDDASFYLTSPVELLPRDTTFNPMRQSKAILFVGDISRSATTCTEDETLEAIARRIITHSVNHIVVVDASGYLKGIITSWDITRAIANGVKELSQIITRTVITALPHDPIESASRKLVQHNISALPVVDDKEKVVGIITAEDLSKLIRE
jgi:CBS domain-containing protein